MVTEYCKIGSISEKNDEIIERAGEVIRSGGLVAFPTETVYGLGGNALDENAAAKIYAAKGRPSDNPLIVHISETADAEKYCITDELFYRLAERFWPGPMTIVMPKRNCIPDTVTGGLGTVALRLPKDPIARAFIAKSACPIAAPSANISGRPSPTKASHVREDLDGRIDMIIDGGDCEVGLESTIVKLENGILKLLRPGGITLEMLREVAPVEIDKAVLEALKEGEKPLAPGMKYRHYAPATKVILVDATAEKYIEFIKSKANNGKIGAIIRDSDEIYLRDSGAALFTYGADFEDEAHNLFARLREVDRHDCEVIYARLPEKSGIGLAVYNRIVKAAGYDIIKIDNNFPEKD